jgi:hypothetical protein
MRVKMNCLSVGMQLQLGCLPRSRGCQGTLCAQSLRHHQIYPRTSLLTTDLTSFFASIDESDTIVLSSQTSRDEPLARTIAFASTFEAIEMHLLCANTVSKVSAKLGPNLRFFQVHKIFNAMLKVGA